MKLPDVYANPINKELNNVQKSFEGSLENRNNDTKVPLLSKINNIFSSKSFVYKSRVRIKTLKDSKEYTIVGKTNNALLTYNGEQIKINDILDIEQI